MSGVARAKAKPRRPRTLGATDHSGAGDPRGQAGNTASAGAQTVNVSPDVTAPNSDSEQLNPLRGACAGLGGENVE